jgi:hypothetical protein
MFGLGVLQVLQERRRLLFGPHSARWLAAVSGGSYTAAAYALNARAVAQLNTTETPPPLAAGSPEERHIVGHGRYLVTPMPQTALTMLGLVLLNALGLVTLFLWAAVMINDYAYIVGEVGLVRRLRPDLPGAVWVVGLLVGLYLLVAGLYTGNRVWRVVGPLLGFGVIALTAGPALDALAAQSWSHGTTTRWMVAVAGLVLLGGSL